MKTAKSTNIYYMNPEGELGCVQFDSHDEKELAELWWEYCKDEGIIQSLTKGITEWVTGTMIEVTSDEVFSYEE